MPEGQLSPKCSAELAPEPLHRLRGYAEGPRQCHEVRGPELHTERPVGAFLLVVPEHPVSAVVDDDRRERKVLLREGGELPARVEEATVAGDGDDWRLRPRGSSQPGGKGETQRSPPDRVRQPARSPDAPEA